MDYARRLCGLFFTHRLPNPNASDRPILLKNSHFFSVAKKSNAATSPLYRQQTWDFDQSCDFVVRHAVAISVLLSLAISRIAIRRRFTVGNDASEQLFESRGFSPETVAQAGTA